MRYSTLILMCVCLTGLASPGAAHLHPGQGRFVQRDPAGYVDGSNLAQYVRGQPTRLRDPSGLACKIGFRCGNAGSSGGVPIPLDHCGVVIVDNSGATTIDGSGGSDNEFGPVNPDGSVGWTPPGGLADIVNLDPSAMGPLSDFPDEKCACLRQQAARWNQLNIARTDFPPQNSNWALKCLTKKCGVPPSGGAGGQLLGWGWDRYCNPRYQPMHGTCLPGYWYCVFTECPEAF